MNRIKSYFYSLARHGEDPLWRRILIQIGLDIMCASERIEWDRLRWFIEGQGSRVFHLGHYGSLDERRMILDGDIPWDALTAERQAEFLPLLDDDVLIEDFKSCFRHLAYNVEQIEGHPALDRLDSEERARIAFEAVRLFRNYVQAVMESPHKMLADSTEEAA